jgi:ferritin-like metal-binding protein YciE
LSKFSRGLGESPQGKTCTAMAGLIAEAKETLDADADPEVLDAALIVAAQKVEHYEIAGYGSVRTFARTLGYSDAARLLETTLKEESNTDERLNQLAGRLNQKAQMADQAAT